MAESVVVGVRVRPFNQREKDLNADVCIEMEGPRTGITDPKNQNNVPTNFAFDESFWSHDGFENDETGYSRACGGSNYADQNYVFETFGKRVLDNAWGGFHCCLFAYGQTGAGKTYTMLGNPDQPGLAPLMIRELYKLIARDRDRFNHSVRASMMELYRNELVDLLHKSQRCSEEDQKDQKDQKKLCIRTDKRGVVQIEGLDEEECQDAAALEAVLQQGVASRVVGATAMNSESSRSHLIMTIRISITNRETGSELRGKIMLVDLAGSERLKKSQVSGDMRKEAIEVNRSLTALGDVIEALTQGQKQVPYRNHKLTQIMGDALGQTAKTVMFVNCSPAANNVDETLMSLKYATRAKKIVPRKASLPVGSDRVSSKDSIFQIRSPCQKSA